jgi:hypothetical protein
MVASMGKETVRAMFLVKLSFLSLNCDLADEGIDAIK